MCVYEGERDICNDVFLTCNAWASYKWTHKLHIGIIRTLLKKNTLFQQEMINPIHSSCWRHVGAKLSLFLLFLSLFYISLFNDFTEPLIDEALTGTADLFCRSRDRENFPCSHGSISKQIWTFHLTNDRKETHDINAGYGLVAMLHTMKVFCSLDHIWLYLISECESDTIFGRSVMQLICFIRITVYSNSCYFH